MSRARHVTRAMLEPPPSVVNDWAPSGWHYVDYVAPASLIEAEAAFRIHKSELGLRPIWHQKAERVKAPSSRASWATCCERGSSSSRSGPTSARARASSWTNWGASGAPNRAAPLRALRRSGAEAHPPRRPAQHSSIHSRMSRCTTPNKIPGSYAALRDGRSSAPLKKVQPGFRIMWKVSSSIPAVEPDDLVSQAAFDRNLVTVLFSNPRYSRMNFRAVTSPSDLSRTQ